MGKLQKRAKNTSVKTSRRYTKNMSTDTPTQEPVEQQVQKLPSEPTNIGGNYRVVVGGVTVSHNVHPYHSLTSDVAEVIKVLRRATKENTFTKVKSEEE